MTDNFPAYTSKVPAFLSRKSMAKLGHLAVRDCPAGQLPATRVGHIRTVRPRRKERTVASCHEATVRSLRRGRICVYLCVICVYLLDLGP